MEDKLIRIFTTLFFLACIIFSVCLLIEIYVFVTQGIAWVPLYYFLFIVPTPLIGYVMMLIGEHVDKKNLHDK